MNWQGKDGRRPAQQRIKLTLPLFLFREHISDSRRTPAHTPRGATDRPRAES